MQIEKMKYLELIGIHLKDDTLNDLFETYDVEVTYDYDRTYENQSDRYFAEIPKLGLNFTFNENQLFSTLHMIPVGLKTFNPFEPDDRIIGFPSKNEARKFANKHDTNFSEGATEFMEKKRDWIRLEYDRYSLHYEYTASKLSMITIMVKD